MKELPTSGDVHVKEQSGFGRPLFWTIIIVTAVVLLFNLLKPTGVPVSSTGITEEAAAKYITYNYTLPEDWSELNRAEQNIQSLAPGQAIEFGIVEDPSDANTVYFASSVYDRRANANLVSIYNYKMNDHSFERIFRTTYQKGEPVGLAEGILPLVHVVGYQDGELILLVRDRNEPLARCDSPYIIGEDEQRSLLTLNVNDPYAGFERYQPSQELLATQLGIQNACVAGR